MIPLPGRPANGGIAYDNRLQRELAMAPPVAEPCQVGG